MGGSTCLACLSVLACGIFAALGPAHQLHVDSPARHLVRLAGHLKSPSEHLESPSEHLESPSEHLESPSEHLESPSEHLESPLEHLESSSEHLESSSERLGSPSEHLESPSEHLESPSEHLESPSQHMESPSQHMESPSQHMESPSKYLESSSEHLESTSEHMESPSEHTESPSKHLESSSEHLESPSEHIESPSKHLESSSEHLESSSEHLESPSEHLESTSEHLEIPLEHLESPSKHMESPSEHMGSPSKHLESSSEHLESPSEHLESLSRHLESPTRYTGSLEVPMESPAVPLKNHSEPVASLCENCPFCSDYLMSKPVTASSISTKWPYSGFLPKSYRCILTSPHEHKIRMPHSPHYHNPLLHWLQIHARFDKRVYGWFEAYDIIVLYGFFIYCCARKRRLRHNSTFSSTWGVFSCLTSVFTSVGNKEKSASDKANGLFKNYDWIFKYPSILRQRYHLVYPVYQPDSWERTASYAKLAFREVSETVSFIQLSGAGFKYTGHDLQVTCVKCNKSLNIRDFTSSPSEARYHEAGCSFVQTATGDAVKAFASEQSSPASEIPSSPISETFPNEACEAPEVQPTNKVQTSGQSQEVSHLLSAAGSQPPSAAPCIDAAGSQEEVRSSNILSIAGIISSGSGDGAGARHDIEEDGPSTFLEPVSKAVDGHDQARKPGISSLDHSENSGGQQRVMAQRARTISRYEASTTPASGAEETGNQRIGSTASQQQASQLPTAVGPGQLTAGAGDQDTPQPGANGASCKSQTQHELDETTDVHSEVCHSDHEVPASDHNCLKNPGHYSYFPIGKFRMEYIPSNVRTPEVHSFFSLVAKLTVRVVLTARKRLRLCHPNEETKFQFGTGFAVSEPGENYQIPNTEHSGKLCSVRKYLPYGRKNEYMYIETNRHLVKDKAEAENTVVEFFYDQTNRRGVLVAKGVDVCHSCVPGDLKSILVCRTSDLTLVNMVKECSEKIKNMAKSFPKSIKEAMMRRVFLFSHPHGAEKVFSFGEYVMVKYRMDKTTTSDGREFTKLVKIGNHTQISQTPEEVRKLMLYTADTCPGSAGGVVVSFKKTGPPETGDIVLDLWMHNGVDVKHSLNASVMRSVTMDDIVNHGHQVVFRPSVQEDMAAEAERAANQVVNSPVFTVSRPPCHPAYVTYRKRLESYPEPFNHVHKREDLADAGFFCAQYADCVRCFQCGLGLKSWRAGDVINVEHFRNKPDCQFLLLKLRESGIDVSTLAAQLRQPRGAEQPQTISDTELQVGFRNDQHLQSEIGVREETRTTLPDPKQLHNTDVKGEPYMSQPPKDISRINPCSQVVTVFHARTSPPRTSPPRTRAAVDTKSSAVQKILEREQYYLKQIFICKICCKNQVKDLFLPCGELVACIECSKLLTHCPSCNKKILATVTTYFS